MKLFNRISATVLSSVDGLVTKIENHEALADAMIIDIQKKAATARVHLKRVQKDRKHCEEQIAKLHTDAELWQKRALNAANSSRGEEHDSDDESRALECLQRRRQCVDQLQTLKKSLKEQISQENQLINQQQKIDERLEEVKQQRNMLRTKESVSGANRTLRSIEGDGTGQLDDLFQRWELSLARDIDFDESPLFVDANSGDTLEQQYLQEEAQASLREELKALKGAGGSRLESEKL